MLVFSIPETKQTLNQESNANFFCTTVYATLELSAASMKMKVNKRWILPFRQTIQFHQIAIFKDFIAHCGSQGHYECSLNLLDFGMHIVRRILHLRFDLEFEV